MLIQCDTEFDVSQNGIEWTPVGMESGAFEYVVNSNGRISVKVSDREVFFFSVDFVPDFVPGYSSFGGYQDAENQFLFRQQFNSRYFQAPFVEGTARYVTYLNNVDVPAVMALEKVANRGTVEAFESGANVLVSVRNVGPLNEPLWLKVGNVLVAFCEPIR